MQIGDAAPSFQLRDLTGEVHRLEEFAGSIIILDFWSCTCPHVDRTDALITKWCREDWAEEVVLLRIASNASESPADIEKAAVQKNIPIILLDSGHVVADLYGAATTPHVFVIRDGRIRYRGSIDNTSFAQRIPTRFFLREAVDALLAGTEPPVTSTPPYGCALIRQALE